MNALLDALRDGFSFAAEPTDLGFRFSLSKGDQVVRRVIDRPSILAARFDLIMIELERMRRTLERASQQLSRCPHCRRLLEETTLCYWCWLDPRDPVSAENPPQRPIGATWELVNGSWRMANGPEAFGMEDD